MKRVGVLVVALGLVLSGACGRFSSSDSASSTNTTEAGEVGSGLGVPSTQPVATQPPRPGTTRPAAADPCAGKPTSSTVTHDNRIRLMLNVSRACAAHSDDIGLSLVVTNTSSAVIHYDPNQLTMFTIKAPPGEQKRRWEDDDCMTRTADIKVAKDLAPGASVTLAATYPAPRDFAQRESCRRLEQGAYEVHALLLVCDESYQDGYCNTAKDTQYRANPISIDLTS